MSDTSRQFTETIKDTMFLQERDERVHDPMIVVAGPALCTFLTRLLKVAEMFAIDHAQTALASREFAEWLDKTFGELDEESFQLQMTEDNFFFNGQLLRFDSRSFDRFQKVRKVFLAHGVNQLTFHRGVGAGELVALIEALQQVQRQQRENLEAFIQPNIDLAQVVEEDVDLPDADPRREIIEMYAGLLIKASVYFERLKRSANPSARHVKRLIQKICDALDEHADVFIGLVNLRLIVGQDFAHATNTCVYAMLLAHAVGLDRLDIVRCGMTALTQDIERLTKRRREQETDFQTGDRTHYQTNLTSVAALTELGAADVQSALRLVTSYERGFPFNRPLPKAWYREELKPHLLSRVIEIARHYDILTQGLEGVEKKSPDRALATVMAKMSVQYDPELTKLFVNVVGIYPVGCTVELSTGDRGLVTKSPAMLDQGGLSVATRPTVKLLDGSERLLDLSSPKNSGLHIVRIIDASEPSQRPGAYFLF